MGDFLWDEEQVHSCRFYVSTNRAFAWNDTERRFRPDFFPPIDIPVIPRTYLFIERNIPIPPGIYDEFCAIIKKKLTQAFILIQLFALDRACLCIEERWNVFAYLHSRRTIESHHYQAIQ